MENIQLQLSPRELYMVYYALTNFSYDAEQHARNVRSSANLKFFGHLHAHCQAVHELKERVRTQMQPPHKTPISQTKEESPASDEWSFMLRWKGGLGNDHQRSV